MDRAACPAATGATSALRVPGHADVEGACTAAAAGGRIAGTNVGVVETGGGVTGTEGTVVGATGTGGAGVGVAGVGVAGGAAAGGAVLGAAIMGVERLAEIGVAMPAGEGCASAGGSAAREDGRRESQSVSSSSESVPSDGRV